MVVHTPLLPFVCGECPGDIGWPTLGSPWNHPPTPHRHKNKRLPSRDCPPHQWQKPTLPEKIDHKHFFLETWRNHDEIHIEMACKKKTWRYVISCYILDSSSFTALRKKFHQLGHTCKNISPASHENLVPARQRLTALLHPECYQHYLLMVWTLIHHRIVFPLSI